MNGSVLPPSPSSTGALPAQLPSGVSGQAPSPDPVAVGQASQGGKRELALTVLATVTRMLERVVPILGADTQEGKAALRALTTLSAHVKRPTQEGLNPQLLSVLTSLRGTPVQQMMMNQLRR